MRRAALSLPPAAASAELSAGFRRSRLLGRLGRLALGAAAIAAGGLAVASTISGYEARTEPAVPLNNRPAVSRAEPAPAAWAEAPGAARLFALAGAGFAEPEVYSVRRNVAGGGRLDQMTFGSAQGSGPYLGLTFYRPLDEPVGDVSFWLEMARRAGEAGLALERSPPAPELLRTRLGDFEVGALRAAGPNGVRECVGFRRQSGDPVLLISGIACPDAAASQAAARDALACVLDGIKLMGPDADPELAALFKGAPAAACRTVGKPRGRG